MSRITVCALLLVSSGLLRAQSDKGVTLAPPDPYRFVKEKKLALIVGINDYQEESGLSKLSYAVQDANDLGKALQSHGYTVDILVNERAMKVPIRRHLEEMLQRVESDSGTILFAFSGHGGQVGKEQFLATYDSSAETLGNEGLSVAWLEDRLASSKAARKMLFVDACRNVTGPGSKAAAAPLTPMAAFSSSAGLRILVSTAPEAISYEDPKLQHGVFTYFLLKGLDGAAALPNGLITFESLAHYVTGAVKEYRPAQVPYSAGSWTGDFYLGGEYKPPVTQPSRAQGEVDEEAWAAIRESKDPRVFQRFMNEFPDSPYLRVAKLRIEALTSSGPGPIIPPVPTQAKPLGAQAAVTEQINQHFEEARRLEKLGNAREALRNYAEGFDLGRTAIAAIPAGEPVPETLIANYIYVGTNYAWYLFDIKDVAAGETVLHALDALIGHYDAFSVPPGLLLAYGRFENLESRYYKDRGKNDEDARHMMRAVDLLLRAAAQPNADLEVMSAAKVMVQNRLYDVKGVEKEEMLGKVCAIADRMMAKDARDARSVTARIDCLRQQATAAREKGDFDAAIGQLQTAGQIINVLNITPDPNMLLSLANLENQIADLMWGEDKDAIRNQHRLAAKEYFVKALRGKTMFESSVGQVEALYRNLRSIEFSESTKELAFYKDVREAVGPSLEAFPQSRSFAYVAGDASAHIGQLIKADTGHAAEAEPFLSQAIDLYDRSGVLSNLSEFSEDFAGYCGIYTDRAEVYGSTGRADLMVADAKKLTAVCGPALTKYPWDFYLRTKFTGSSRNAGQVLFNARRYREALPFLEYASHWGSKDSSNLLARMYREGLGATRDAVKAKGFEDLAAKQRMLRFTVPIDVGGQKSKFNVYVTEWPTDYAFEGIDDQITWLKEARGATMDPAIGESFRKLHKLARENKVSFPDICEYALKDDKSNPPKK